MNISKAARLSGLPAKTIRYYEDIGLIRPMRDTNGYRVFQQHDISNLTFLARARSLGFSIDDCRSLLHLHDDQSRASADVKDIAQAHLDRIDAKLEELGAMRATLTGLVVACAGDQHPDCAILKSLSKSG